MPSFTTVPSFTIARLPGSTQKAVVEAIARVGADCPRGNGRHRTGAGALSAALSSRQNTLLAGLRPGGVDRDGAGPSGTGWRW